MVFFVARGGIEKVLLGRIVLQWLKVRRYSWMLLLASALVLRAQDTENPKLTKADAEYQRIKTLVDAGALPRKALDDAEDAREEARDAGVLNALLYGKVSLEEFTEQQAKDMVDASERRLERKSRRLESAKKRVELGVAPITYLTSFIEELDAAKRVRELALARVHLFEELVIMARAEEAVEQPDHHTTAELPRFEKFDGVGSFTTAQWTAISSSYEREFGKPLPVSAKGETALHRSWGFDHRGRVDVAVYPDSREGQWLRRYLEAMGITYIAFRGSVPGKATAAHIHVGPPSLRIRRAD